MDETKIGFWTGANYLKRLSSAQDSQEFNLANGATTTITVNHDLGHIPGDWNVGMDRAGTLWSNNLPWNGMDNPSAVPSENVTWRVWATEDDLIIRVENFTGSSQSGTMYWTVYMDYDV